MANRSSHLATANHYQPTQCRWTAGTWWLWVGRGAWGAAKSRAEMAHVWGTRSSKSSLLLTLFLATFKAQTWQENKPNHTKGNKLAALIVQDGISVKECQRNISEDFKVTARQQDRKTMYYRAGSTPSSTDFWKEQRNSQT